MNDFEMGIYFNMYKDLPLPNRNKFRTKFKKKHKDFKEVDKLILKIEDYQIKKYGTLLYEKFSIKTKAEALKLSKLAIQRRYSRRHRK